MQKGSVALVIIIIFFLIGGGLAYLIIKNLQEEKQQPIILDEKKTLERENYLENKQTEPILKNQEQEVVIPRITFKLKFEGDCEYSKEPPYQLNSVFNILRDETIIGEVESPFCETVVDQISILAQNREYLYFAFTPPDLGGYIMFFLYRDLCQIDLKNNKISRVIDSAFNGISFSLDLKKIVYNRLPTLQQQEQQKQEIILLDLINNNIIKKFSYPTEHFNFIEQWQFGNFKFSPKEDKVAFVGVRGPADEKSGVYILSLESGDFQLVEEKKNYIFKIEGWLDNNTVIYK